MAQKQILTPGLVQMVSVLALNRLELREMINQEIMANPVLEEVPEEDVAARTVTPTKRSSRKKPKKFPRPKPPIPSTNSISAPSSRSISIPAPNAPPAANTKKSKSPRSTNSFPRPPSLADHLAWQLSVSICTETVRKIAEAIIGNLDENGYLTATLDEIAQSGNYSMEDVEEALAMVQEFDPPGVGARDLQECLLMQLKAG